ncbi:ATP-binding protein [Sporolactobacillus vineae]|uniref:ATP-binding protein n=1 Tax=Sporolactobacillus vineae TaxID=444463 RepID=UPI00028A3858|nr:ATP-binding protein [Sporolactobacillus vineae]
MIRNSIITKLWATIIAIVTIVLVFLTVLLLQFFDNSQMQESTRLMNRIADKSAGILERGDAGRVSLVSVSDIAGVYSTRSVLLTKDHYWISSTVSGVPDPGRRFFVSDKDLNQTLTRGRTVIKRSSFPIGKGQEQLTIVGRPVRLATGGKGAVFVIQSLAFTQNATSQSNKLIYISAGIAILLTTFFAFFLSTRIGAPLRRMRSAVLQISSGNFDNRVPVVTRDEVGDLAIAFNKMSTDLKNNMTALTQEKEQLAGILQNMADGVLLLDKDGNIVAANPPGKKFIRSWNYEHEGEASPAALLGMLKKTVAGAKQTVDKFSIQGRFWVIILTPLFSRSKVRGAVAVLRDMTEERHIDQMKKSFVANVSHELRTPITMIQGYSEAIIDDIAGSDQEKKDMAGIILDESKRLGRLVNELLDLARLEAGHFQLKKRDVALAPFLSHAVTKFDNLAANAGINLKLDVDFDSSVRFIFDPDRIEQVLTNLIDNAIRHTREQGAVTVTGRLGEQGLTVSVRDTGVGIAHEDLPFVFERFYKADKARTRGKSGTGLGLAIAKHIVDAHDGDISVNSKKGQGTTFRFTLPVPTKTG